MFWTSGSIHWTKISERLLLKRTKDGRLTKSTFWEKVDDGLYVAVLVCWRLNLCILNTDTIDLPIPSFLNIASKISLFLPNNTFAVLEEIRLTSWYSKYQISHNARTFINTGVGILPTQTMHNSVKSPKLPYICSLFDSPQFGNLMIPDMNSRDPWQTPSAWQRRSDFDPVKGRVLHLCKGEWRKKKWI